MKLIEAINIFYNYLSENKDKETLLLTKDFIEARKIINNIDPKLAKVLADEALKLPESTS